MIKINQNKMFFNDKDYKKGVAYNKRPVDKNRNNTDNKKVDDVVQIARIEREERAKNRELSSVAIKLQKWYRGRITAKKTILLMRSEFDSKLVDIEKLSILLLERNNIIFVPPSTICIDLAKKLTAFGFHGIEVSHCLFLYICMCIFICLYKSISIRTYKNIGS